MRACTGTRCMRSTRGRITIAMTISCDGMINLRKQMKSIGYPTIPLQLLKPFCMSVPASHRFIARTAKPGLDVDIEYVKGLSAPNTILVACSSDWQGVSEVLCLTLGQMNTCPVVLRAKILIVSVHMPTMILPFSSIVVNFRMSS